MFLPLPDGPEQRPEPQSSRDLRAGRAVVRRAGGRRPRRPRAAAGRGRAARAARAAGPAARRADGRRLRARADHRRARPSIGRRTRRPRSRRACRPAPSPSPAPPARSTSPHCSSSPARPSSSSEGSCTAAGPAPDARQRQAPSPRRVQRAPNGAPDDIPFALAHRGDLTARLCRVSYEGLGGRRDGHSPWRSTAADDLGCRCSATLGSRHGSRQSHTRSRRPRRRNAGGDPADGGW